VDGDTIEVLLGGEELRVRYIGIDTPETVDPRRPVGCFGKEASARNRELVEGKAVALEKDVSETDRFGRLLRYVWLDPSTGSGQALMVNARLVEEGYATASTFPPDVRYAERFAALQAEAQEAGRGLWGACVTPEAQAGCAAPLIKGNINSAGEKIYHVPGGASYEDTQIDETKGERWFCAETEAVAAGWRKSSR
jgi:micrococcal nuclease